MTRASEKVTFANWVIILGPQFLDTQFERGSTWLISVAIN